MVADAAAAPARAAMVTLADVAGRQVRLVGLAVIPLHTAGAVVTHGFIRWVFVAFVLTGAVAMRQRRPMNSVQAVLSVAVAAGAMMAYEPLLPQLADLMTACMAASVILVGLMIPRPFAEIGIGTVPAAYAASWIVFDSSGRTALRAICVAVAAVGLGVALLSIRTITERAVTMQIQAIADANRQLNRTDPLTGLVNRRGFDESLRSAWAHAKNSGEQLAVIMIDVDNFKAYNDRYGHPSGDDCLKKVASALAGSLRDNDLIARYGGEEFVIILPNSNIDDARRVAERARLNVARLHWEHAASSWGFVSVSVGIGSAWPDGGICAEDLVRQADNGLYEAKRNGRNCVAAGPLECAVDHGAPDMQAIPSAAGTIDGKMGRRLQPGPQENHARQTPRVSAPIQHR